MGRYTPSLLDTRPRRCFFAQAAFGTAFTYLTSGVFLSGLALLMGAGDVLVSYLSVIVNLCGVLILAFSALLERVSSRKRLTLVLTALSRLATLFLAAIPALAPPRLRLPLFLAAVVAAFTLQAQTTVALNQWMMGFVDAGRSGRYISLRQTLTLAVTVVLSVAGGQWMDAAGGSYRGFVLLFAAAGAMGACELVLLSRTPDGPAYRPPPRGHGLRELISLPRRDRAFAGFVAYVTGFYLLLNISDSFTMVFLMKYLALPYGVVTGLYMLISLPQIALLGAWGRLSDRRGHAFALRASIWLFAAETLFMAFASPRTWFVFVPAAFLAASVGNAGFTVAVFNRRYELMPAQGRIAYDNFYTAAIGLGFLLGPLLGGLIKWGLEATRLGAGVLSFPGIRLLYPISSAGILLLQGLGRRRV